MGCIPGEAFSTLHARSAKQRDDFALQLHLSSRQGQLLMSLESDTASSMNFFVAEKYGGCWEGNGTGDQNTPDEGHNEIYFSVLQACKLSLLFLEIPWAEQRSVPSSDPCCRAEGELYFLSVFSLPNFHFLSADCGRCWLSLKQHGQAHAARLSPVEGWVGGLAQSWAWLVLSVSFSLTSFWHISDYLPLLSAKSLQDMYWVSSAKQSF